MSRTLRKYTKILMYASIMSFTFLLAFLGFHDNHEAQGRAKAGMLVNFFAQSALADAPQVGDTGDGTGDDSGDDDDDDDNDDGCGDDDDDG